jgi:HxlR-like helix-turn-helix
MSKIENQEEVCDFPPEKRALGYEILGRIADKWTLLVIGALETGELRFSQVRQRVPGVSQKMLTKTLRQLERTASCHGACTQACRRVSITGSHRLVKASANPSASAPTR